MTWCRHISRARRTHTTIRRCYFHVCVCVRFLSERALPGVRRPVTISRNATRNCFHSALPFASLPPLFASLSLSLSPSFILHTLEDSSIVDNRTEFRTIDRTERRRKVLKMFRTTWTRKLRGPVSTAPRDSSTRCPSASKHFPFDYSSHTVHREKIGDSRPTTLRGFGRIWSEPSTDRWSKR